jgi:hypothetical protein
MFVPESAITIVALISMLFAMTCGYYVALEHSQSHNTVTE